MKKICNCSNKKRKRCTKEKKGYGLIDYIINKLPEIHIPGYQYCGPGTDLEKRLARGDPGVNKLDQACKHHDIAYTKIKNSNDRRQADKELVARALPRIYSQDAKLGERAAALLVSGLMGAKIGLSKIGLGLNKRNSGHRKRKSMKARSRRVKSKKRIGKRKKSRSKLKRKSIAFSKLVGGVKASIKKSKLKSSSLGDTIKAAIRSVKDMRREKTVKIPRVLKVPKFGGSLLPILPIISALSAIGSIPTSAAAVVKAIQQIGSAVKHNIGSETKTKIGRGLYLMSNTTGSGFYLKPYQQQR